MDDFIDALDGLTDRVIAVRVLRQKGFKMPLEIKGLGQQVASAKKGIADVRAAAADLSVSTEALVSELKDVKTQVEAARSDLKFEAETLGNSVSPSGTTTASQ
jgi:hypothetical protein